MKITICTDEGEVLEMITRDDIGDDETIAGEAHPNNAGPEKTASVLLEGIRIEMGSACRQLAHRRTTRLEREKGSK